MNLKKREGNVLWQQKFMDSQMTIFIWKGKIKMIIEQPKVLGFLC
jgi:hypothetical protein